jgi:type III pantothenate kinase
VPARSDPAREALRRLTDAPPLSVSPERDLPLALDLDAPETFGADRLAAAVGGWMRYGTAESGVLVVDAGTALTCEVVDARGVLRGGAIAPGPALAARALHDHTAQLPETLLDFPASPVGRTTTEAIRSGVLYGLLDSASGMIRRVRRELDADPVVVATGGWCDVLGEHVPAIEHVDPHLVLRGIREATVAVLLVVLAATLGSARRASAQQPAAPTLAGWQEHLHVALMDRRHADGGYFFDRGVFRRLMPVMDHEYLLDAMTYRFTPAQDAVWRRDSSGYRSYMGSIDKSNFVTRHHLRQRLALGGGLSFTAEGYFQEDLRASRFLVAPGFSYQWNKRHRIGFRQTFVRYKPDMDLRLFYELREPQWGRFRLDVTALDVANNFVFEGIGVDPTLEDTVRIYERRPWLVAARARSVRWRGLRLELAGGVQTPSRARVSSQNYPNRRFTWREGAAYAGALLSYHLSLATLEAVAGLRYRRTHTRMRRTAPDSSVYTSDYRSRQNRESVSGFARVRWRQLRASGRLTFGTYDDRQAGADFDQSTVPQAFHYDERFRKVRLRLVRVPPGRGLTGGLEYLALRRDYDESGYEALREARFLTFRQTRWNHRLVLLAGYQFTAEARVMLGGAFDLDGDQFAGRDPVRYDGGFGRISVRW